MDSSRVMWSSKTINQKLPPWSQNNKKKLKTTMWPTLSKRTCLWCTWQPKTCVYCQAMPAWTISSQDWPALLWRNQRLFHSNPLGLLWPMSCGKPCSLMTLINWTGLWRSSETLWLSRRPSGISKSLMPLLGFSVLFSPNSSKKNRFQTNWPCFYGSRLSWDCIGS